MRRRRVSHGSFLLSEDEKVYIDLGFFDELNRRFGAPGQFAQAYVLAHELGHHIQKLIGIEGKVHQLQETNSGDAKPLSVKLELQADCFAGAWAMSAGGRRCQDCSGCDLRPQRR